MTFCGECGKQAGPNDKFCTECGVPLKNQQISVIDERIEFNEKRYVLPKGNFRHQTICKCTLKMKQ